VKIKVASFYKVA